MMINGDEEDQWVCSRGWLNRFYKRMVKMHQNSHKYLKSSMLSCSNPQDSKVKSEFEEEDEFAALPGDED